jgi:hypothetical protein
MTQPHSKQRCNDHNFDDLKKAAEIVESAFISNRPRTQVMFLAGSAGVNILHIPIPLSNRRAHVKQRIVW